MMKDVKFSCMQKVRLAVNFSVECLFQLKTFSGGKYFLVANFQVQCNITHMRMRSFTS